MKYKRNCRICGQTFITDSTNKITCSDACSAENKRRLHQIKYLRNNPDKGKGNKTQSLCLGCKRAYAKPFDAGGCDKILYGTPVYEKAQWVLKEQQKRDPYWVLVVEECDLYKSDMEG